jgi:hypothetical protein
MIVVRSSLSETEVTAPMWWLILSEAVSEMNDGGNYKLTDENRPE